MPCYDGSVAGGLQVFRFHGVSPAGDASDPTSNMLVGEDGNRDALPTVLLESLATGLPCVSTPVSGIPEILDQGRAGRIVPEQDPKALADVIAELLEDGDARLEIARRGRERAQQLFDARRSAATLSGWFTQAREALTAR